MHMYVFSDLGLRTFLTCKIKGKSVENVVKLLNTDKTNKNGTLIGMY